MAGKKEGAGQMYNPQLETFLRVADADMVEDTGARSAEQSAFMSWWCAAPAVHESLL